MKRRRRSYTYSVVMAPKTRAAVALFVMGFAATTFPIGSALATTDNPSSTTCIAIGIELITPCTFTTVAEIPRATRILTCNQKRKQKHDGNRCTNLHLLIIVMIS